MKVRKLKEAIKQLPLNTEIIVIQAEQIYDQYGKLVQPGLGYLDLETSEFVYIGEINILSDINDEE